MWPLMSGQFWNEKYTYLRSKYMVVIEFLCNILNLLKYTIYAFLLIICSNDSVRVLWGLQKMPTRYVALPTVF